MSSPVVGYIFANVNPASLTQINGLAVYSAANLDDDFTTVLALFNITTAFPTTPQVGMMCYRTDLSGWYIWNGSSWVQNTAFASSINITGAVACTEAIHADGGIYNTTAVASSHGQRFVANGTWVVPANITSIIISGSAGGGGGGAGVAGDSGGGGGGAGGTIEAYQVNVTAGDTLTVTIGAAGAAGSGGAGGDAADTTIVDTTSSTTLVTLKGGLGGGYGDVTTVVAGGGARTGSTAGAMGYLITTSTALSVGGAGGGSVMGGGGPGGVGAQAGYGGGGYGGGGGGGAGADGGLASPALVYFWW